MPEIPMFWEVSKTSKKRGGDFQFPYGSPITFSQVAQMRCLRVFLLYRKCALSAICPLFGFLADFFVFNSHYPAEESWTLRTLLELYYSRNTSWKMSSRSDGDPSIEAIWRLRTKSMFANQPELTSLNREWKIIFVLIILIFNYQSDIICCEDIE